MLLQSMHITIGHPGKWDRRWDHRDVWLEVYNTEKDG